MREVGVETGDWGCDWAKCGKVRLRLGLRLGWIGECGVVTGPKAAEAAGLG